jgi:hypothetical protein
MIHVLPIDDSAGHTLDTTCACEPCVECNDEIFVAHNAWDTREQSVEVVDARIGWAIVRGDGIPEEIL